MGPRIAVGVWVVVSLTIGWSSAAAQGTSAASVTGVVKDASGAVLPGVTVEVASPALIEKVRSTVTDADGQYRVIELRTGVYSVTFALSGFVTFRRDGLELPPSFTATVNAELKIGGLEETITVTGQSPLVDVQNVAQQKTISKTLLDTVPTGKSTLGFIALMPSAITPTAAQDVGGSKGELSVRMSVHGAKQADSRLLQDGMQYNSLGSDGNARTFFVNPLGAQEIVIDTGSGGSAEYALGGATLNIISRDGGNRFSGSVFAGGTTHDLQSDNLTTELMDKGLRSVNGVRGLYDLNGVIGGPIMRDKLWFTSAHRRWGRESRIANLFHDSNTEDWIFTPDVSRPVDAADDQRSDNIRLTWQAAAKHKVTFSYDWQHNNALNAAGGLDSGLLALDAVVSGDAYCNRVNLYQGTWNSTATSRLLFEAGASYFGTDRSNFTRGETDNGHSCGGNAYAISVREQSNNFTYHGTGMRFSEPNSYTFQRFSTSYLTGGHTFKVGLQALETLTNSQYLEMGAPNLPVAYTFRNGSPTSLTEFASPRGSHTQSRAQVRPSLGIFFQDQWTVRRLTLNMGVRYDYVRAYAPAIDVPAGILGPPATHFDEADCLPCWQDFTPRFAVVYDLFGDGKTALKASLNKYVEGKQTTFVNTYGPANAIVTSTTRSWTDSNGNFFPDCDLTNTGAQNLTGSGGDVCGAMANQSFGQSVVRTHPDPNWISGWNNRGYNWATTVEVAHQLGSGVAVNAGYYRRWFGNQVATDNTLVTPADFDPYCITAPVDSRLPANISGSQICGLYDVTPTKFGLVDNVVSLAKNFGKATETYNGVDVNLNMRLKNGAMLSGGWNLGNTFAAGTGTGTTFSKLNTCFVVDSPQALYNCESANPYQHRFKVHGSYQLPWDMQVAANFQSLPGANYGATLTVPTAQIAPSLGRNLSGGTANATIELLPLGSGYFPERITQLDLRFTKIFRINGTRLLGNVDLFNALNNNSVLQVNSTYGPSWLMPTQILDARLIKFSLQVDF